MDLLVTSQGDTGAQDTTSSRPTLADAQTVVTSTLDAGTSIAKGSVKGYLQLGKMGNDLLFYAFDFVNNPLQEGSKLAKTIGDGAHIFASQFDGSYTRLNELLSHEYEATKTFFHGQVAFYEGAYGKVLSPKTIETIVGAQYYASKMPSNAWEHFKGLSLEDKSAFIVKESLTGFAAVRIGSLVAEVANTAKIGAIAISNALKEGLAATSEAATTAVQEAKVVFGEIAQGAESVALAGTSEMIPAGVEKGLANSVLRECGEASSSMGVIKNVLPNAAELRMSETVKKHIADIIKKGPFKGELSRPYIDSNGTTLLLDQIMRGKEPVKDLFLANGLRWETSGSFRGSEGIWELVVNLDTKTIVHFNFVT